MFGNIRPYNVQERWREVDVENHLPCFADSASDHIGIANDERDVDNFFIRPALVDYATLPLRVAVIARVDAAGRRQA
jgi:hypothetical protein